MRSASASSDGRLCAKGGRPILRRWRTIRFMPRNFFRPMSAWRFLAQRAEGTRQAGTLRMGNSGKCRRRGGRGVGTGWVRGGGGVEGKEIVVRKKGGGGLLPLRATPKH